MESLEEPHRDARSNQTKLGVALRTFKNRELGGIKLLIDESAAKSQQYKYRFVRVSGEDTPPEVRRVVDREEAELQKLKAGYEQRLEWLATRNGTSVSVEREKDREWAAQQKQRAKEALERITQAQSGEDWLKPHKSA